MSRPRVQPELQSLLPLQEPLLSAGPQPNKKNGTNQSASSQNNKYIPLGQIMQRNKLSVAYPFQPHTQPEY